MVVILYTLSYRPILKYFRGIRSSALLRNLIIGPVSVLRMLWHRRLPPSSIHFREYLTMQGALITEILLSCSPASGRVFGYR